MEMHIGSKNKMLQKQLNKTEKQKWQQRIVKQLQHMDEMNEKERLPKTEGQTDSERMYRWREEKNEIAHCFDFLRIAEWLQLHLRRRDKQKNRIKTLKTPLPSIFQ
jgi:hypothetical protein